MIVSEIASKIKRDNKGHKPVLIGIEGFGGSGKTTIANQLKVALVWLLDKGALPIPKSISKQHIDENIASKDIKLSEDEILSLDRL